MLFIHFIEKRVAVVAVVAPSLSGLTFGTKKGRRKRWDFMRLFNHYNNRRKGSETTHTWDSKSRKNLQRIDKRVQVGGGQYEQNHAREQPDRMPGPRGVR